jgi:hypothetical protein
MLKFFKKFSSKVLLVTFTLLIITPAIFIANQYGIVGKNKPKHISISANLVCNTINNVEFFLTPDGDAAIASMNLKEGRSYKSSDCREITFHFGKFAPQEIVLSDFGGSTIFPVDKIEKNADGYHKLKITLGIDVPSIPSLIQFRYDNAIEKFGLAKYRLSANMRLDGFTHSPSVSRIDSILHFSLPFEYFLTEHAPTSISQKVDHKLDHIKYIFDDNVETIVTSWTNPEESENGILQMLLLSALFGVGISGLIELMISKIKEDITNSQ